LSKLDFVLISHNHFDHLDNKTVDLLHLKFNKALTW
jgi:L-ascorbate metabolism protein UlaG (beta-lactamase superfamily)